MTDKEMILDSLKKNNGVIETKQFAERGIDNKVFDLVSEIGDNMDVFSTAKHLCSWAGLTPTNNESVRKKKFKSELLYQTTSGSMCNRRCSK